MEPQPTAPQASQNEQPLPAVPDPWQGGFKLYKYSKQAMKRGWVTVFVLYVIIALLSSIASQLKSSDTSYAVGTIIAELLAILFSGAITVALIAAVRGHKPTIGGSVKQAASVYLNLLVYGIVAGLIQAVSLALFIIPFFFIAPRLALGTYFVVDKRLNAFAALEASWKITRGSAKRVWGIWLTFLVIALLIITIIGIPFAIYFLVMYAAAPAVLYEFLITKQQPTASADAPVAAAPVANPEEQPAAAPQDTQPPQPPVAPAAG